MNLPLLERFEKIWTCDFEYISNISNPGERPVPVCMVAHELRSGTKLRLWQDELQAACPPFTIGPEALFVFYFASADLGCFRVLGWPTPVRILDLFTEFRNLTNGCRTVAGNSLLGALAHSGLDGIGAGEKREMRDLIQSGGPWTSPEQRAIFDYCESDVDALDRLLPAMLPRIDPARALLRGRYMAAVAAMEFNGVPVDPEQLSLLRRDWTRIQDHLIARINDEYQVFEGRSFRRGRFQAWLIRNNYPWPVLDSGQLCLDDDTFRDMAKIYPAVAPLRELRHALSELRLNDLAVGSDGRNRCLLSPFGARTGRNTPSNTKYIFGPAVWLRNLIKPPPGHGLAYVDWIQQEFGIAAVLSNDPEMVAAYQSGDCYLAFAKQARAVPADATKTSHSIQRELFKQCVLGTQYGMEARSLALRINQPEIVARRLLQSYKEVYRKFWIWSDNAVDHATLHGWQQTVFGWTKRIPPGDSNPRALRNFPMQANGGEMLRLACCLGIERGIKICAPVHDAVLIEAPVNRLEEDIATMRGCMEEASRVVLAGFFLRTEAKTVIHPDHYSDPRGEWMWREIAALL